MEVVTPLWPCSTADRIMSDTLTYGDTFQLLVIWKGKIVFERNRPDLSSHSTSLSWSVTKSWVHALVGCAILAGKIPSDIHAPVHTYWPRNPGWSTCPQRSKISMYHLLCMRDGLSWREEYADKSNSDVMPMFEQEDMALYAASRPCVFTPGTVFNYSSGTTNIICDILTCALLEGKKDVSAARRKEAFLDFFDASLKQPLGCAFVRNAAKFDKAGTFVGSSFLYASARELARLPLLYMQDGVWNNVRILPVGWAAEARTPTAKHLATGCFAAHWWVDSFGSKTFSCNGFEGQYVIAIPGSELVVCRLGKSREDGSNQKMRLRAALLDMVDELTRRVERTTRASRL